jgi:hypothetical protein
MTNFEQFQSLQIELVRAGFETTLHAQPHGDDAVLSMFVDLRKQSATDIEKLDALTTRNGFSYTVGDDSLAAITFPAAER